MSSDSLTSQSDPLPSVLVTGASGEVGRGVVPLLQDHFSLRLLGLEPNPHDPRYHQVDLLDWAALRAAMMNVEAVLHLAIAPGHPGTYEDDAFNDQRFDVNVKGTYHVFEVARRVGVRRVVLVSSLMVVWGYGDRQRVPGDAPPRPVGTYALTKMLGEQIAEQYALQHGMEVIVLRIAAPIDPATLQPGQMIRPQQVPFPDLAQAFIKALTVPLKQFRDSDSDRPPQSPPYQGGAGGVDRDSGQKNDRDGFHIVTIVGDSSRGVWGLEPARRVLGYIPTIRLDDLEVAFADPFDVPRAR